MEKKNETYCWSQAMLKNFYNKAHSGKVGELCYFLEMCLQKLYTESSGFWQKFLLPPPKAERPKCNMRKYSCFDEYHHSFTGEYFQLGPDIKEVQCILFSLLLLNP